MNHLRSGTIIAFIKAMKNINLFTIVLFLLLPAGLHANPGPEVNVNERYLVESVEFTNIDESKINKDLREEAQKFVGQKYSAKAADTFTQKLHEELKNKISVSQVKVKVDKGIKPEHVKVVFLAEKPPRKKFVNLYSPFLLYHSKEGFSGAFHLDFNKHNHQFIFGLVSDADQLLERNAGLYLSLRIKSLGTDILGFKADFEAYHQSFDRDTLTALEQNPDVPDFYRARHNFAPSLEIRPIKDLTINTGLSFQRIEHQYPSLHTDTAYAGTGDIRYSRDLFLDGYRQTVKADYSLRTATRVLDSDYVYTRHHWTTGYELSKGKNALKVSFTGGIIGGTAPLFERFSLGNSKTLRGWNKLDIAPIGGSRMAHGSLEYRHRCLEVFYDVGTVWDSGKYNPVRHGFGFGFTSGKLFISLAFPVRLHHVAPIFMTGIRF